MRTTVVTLYWGDYFDRYGVACIDSHDRLWPDDWDLIVVADRDLPIPRALSVPRIDGSMAMQEFASKYEDDPQANGRVPDSRWKSKELERGHSWRYDAVKWAPQLIAPSLALPYVNEGDVLVWLDGDVRTFKTPPTSLFADLLGNADVVHLGRPDKWSEIGFWACRILPSTIEFIHELAAIYSTGRVFELGQWHSAYAWDACAREAAAKGVVVRSLTDQKGHVWFDTPLGRYMDHMKGNRKDRGRSYDRMGMR